jgi:large subunit ribosomal protein L25
VSLPEGVRPVIADRDFTIATIAGSSAMKSEASETEEAAPAAEGTSEEK